MPSHKIVARFTDGRTLKGTTFNFNETAPDFVLMPEGAEKPQPTRVEMKDLKALFFVRDFAGDPDKKDKKGFRPGQPYAGRRIEVTFKDGEVLIGSVLTYSPQMPGFFVFPADDTSNTLRVFAIASSVRSVRWL
jgi:hypothetical protein